MDQAFASGSIPQIYICQKSGIVMQDPVIELLTGQIFDRSCLQSSSRAELNVYSLDDLKEVINQYMANMIQYSTGNANEVEQESEHKKQKVETNEICQEPECQTVQAIKQYKNKVDKIVTQNTNVNICDQAVKKFSAYMIKSITDLQVESAKFFEVVQNLSQIGSSDSSHSILRAKEQLVQSNKKFQLLVGKTTNYIMEVHKKKSEFENQLQILEELEEELKQLRVYVKDELNKSGSPSGMTSVGLREAKASPEIQGIVPHYADLVNDLSKEYYEPTQVNQQDLDQLFKSGEVSNISVRLQSSEECHSISVQGSVRVKNLKVSSAQRGVQYLKIYTLDENASIYFEDCSFEGVGLFLCGPQNSSKKAGIFQCRNISVQNAGETGLAVQGVEKCVLTSVTIKNPIYYGISLENISQCLCYYIFVDSCGLSGLQSKQVCGEIHDSTLTNCKQYGVMVDGGIMKGRLLQSTGNIRGQFFGNFTQM